jgi:pyrimidine oxygenase
VNAGTSPTGIDFAARHCDWIFCSGDITEMKSTALAVHEQAKGYQRRIDSMTFAYIVPGETDAQAQEKYEWLASEIDEEAADTFVLRALEGLRSAGYSPSKIEATSSTVRGRVGESFYRKMALGLGGIPIVGSPQTIAEHLRAISQEGRQRGVLVSFFDFPEGLKVMRERILPILRRMGLRQ